MSKLHRPLKIIILYEQFGRKTSVEKNKGFRLLRRIINIPLDENPSYPEEKELSEDIHRFIFRLTKSRFFRCNALLRN